MNACAIALTRVFDFDGRDIRIVLRDGEPWWVATDVAAVLGLGRTHDAIRGLDSDEKGAERIRTPGGPQSMTVVSEPGLYTLVVRSNKPDAQRFRRWVTHEVLPQLRRTGSYSIPGVDRQAFVVPRTYAEALRALADEVESRERAEQRARALEPAAASWNELVRAKGNYSLRQAASVLNQCPTIGIGQNRLMKILIELGMVGENRIPYAKHAKHVVLRPRSDVHPETGEGRLVQPQVRLTMVGIQYVHRRLGGGGRLSFEEPWD